MGLNLTRYENLIRRIIKDLPDRDRQGYFWDSSELNLALNLSQLVFVKYVLATKQWYFLYRLFVQQTVNSTVSRIPPAWDILIPVTAWVIDQNGQSQPARIYYGDGLAANIGHNACVVWNDVIQFYTRDRINGGPIPTTGTIYFYRYPQPVYLETDTTILIPQQPDPRGDFDEYVYEQYIVPYGIVILGMKEITNQRDQKYFKRLIRDIMRIPESFANFVMDFEFTGVKVRPGRPPSQEITE